MDSEERPEGQSKTNDNISRLLCWLSNSWVKWAFYIDDRNDAKFIAITLLPNVWIIIVNLQLNFILTRIWGILQNDELFPKQAISI